LLLYALAYFDRQIIALMVRDLRHDLHLSDFRIGLLQGLAFVLFYSVFGVVFGYAADRYRRRRIIALGILIWACAVLACGLAQNFLELFAARMLVGLGEAALVPASFSMISDLFPRGRLTMAMSVYSVGAQVGAQGSLVLGGLLLKWAQGGVALPVVGVLAAWRLAFVVASLPAFAAIALLFLVPEPQRRQTGALAGVTWKEVFRFIRTRRTFFICHFLGFGCLMALTAARLEWLPTLLQRRYQWPVDKVGLVLGLFGMVVGSLALLANGFVVERRVGRGERDAHFRVYVVGSLMAGVAGLAFLAPTPWLLFAGMLLAAMPLALGGIAASCLRMVTPSQYRGSVYALYQVAVGFAGLALGPAMVGWITDSWFHDPAKLYLSMTTTFLLLAPVALVAFVVGLKPMREAAAALERVGDA
jgi:MFS family permease